MPGVGWVGRETDEEDTFFTHLVCTRPVSFPLSSGHVSELWHPEELECTSYFQYCSPQGSRNHKPSSSKLQDWVKSHETAVKITFQGSFSLSSVFRDLCLHPARFRISLQQKAVKTYIVFRQSGRQSCGKESWNFTENTITARYIVVAGDLVFAHHNEWDDFRAPSWKVLRIPCKCKMGMLGPSSSFILSVLKGEKNSSGNWNNTVTFRGPKLCTVVPVLRQPRWDWSQDS